MRLRIRHRTLYRYDRPVERGVQLVRLFPRPHAGLDLLRWKVSGANGPTTTPHEDGVGNLAALMSLKPGAMTEDVLVEGEVETRDMDGWLKSAPEALPPAYFQRDTERTLANDAIRALSAEVVISADGLDRLSEIVRDRIDFRAGETDSGTTATEALARGAGVCQDHAHVLIAAARAAGLPARYVSGYFWPGEMEEAASHAWVEIYLEEQGWLGLDPANRRRAGEAYVRVAVGLDYAQAAPITGVRYGGGAERLTIDVSVKPAARLQQ